ncbi:hypothetical protein SUDANB105_00851 [Streptomyces sp. enrichment culture]|uniref:hypothetical protein n=1 Tax=Streptomyces sp. enrichment culture TaxID=1795815 RepID=UPI003F561C06
MRSYFVPKPPGEPVTDVRPQRVDLHRRAVRRAQLVFLALNAVPFALGVVLSCAAELAAAPVYGRFTLGLGWGILQLGVFAGSVWWYENRGMRVCDLLERPLVSGASSASSASEPTSPGR